MLSFVLYQLEIDVPCAHFYAYHPDIDSVSDPEDPAGIITHQQQVAFLEMIEIIVKG